MENKINPKVQKILDKSKIMKGKTMTGEPADEVEIYSRNNVKDESPVSNTHSQKL